MKAVRISKTTVTTRQTTQNYIPEGLNLRQHRCQHLQSHNYQTAVTLPTPVGIIHRQRPGTGTSLRCIYLIQHDLEVREPRCSRFRSFVTNRIRPHACRVGIPPSHSPAIAQFIVSSVSHLSLRMTNFVLYSRVGQP